MKTVKLTASPEGYCISVLLTQKEVDMLVHFIAFHVGWIGHGKDFQEAFQEFATLLDKVQRENNGEPPIRETR